MKIIKIIKVKVINLLLVLKKILIEIKVQIEIKNQIVIERLKIIIVKEEIKNQILK